jgi:hypothetical protein
LLFFKFSLVLIHFDSMLRKTIKAKIMFFLE